MFYLRVALTILAFLAAAAYGIGIALVRRDRSRVAHDYARLLARLVRPALGLRVRIRGRENLLAQRPCIYIVNHQSIVDVPVLAEIFPPDTVVIGKKELRRIPLFGWLYERTGNILIDRADSHRAVGRMREAEQAILERGVSVWVFPEGTRGRVPGELLPFKKGAFHMAIATGAPLVPVVVSPLAERVDLERRRIRPGPVEVRVLEPIPARGLRDSDLGALLALAHARMQAALGEMARAESGGEAARPVVGREEGGGKREE
jgi:1-acyl-sn-glycerol-3-phosphate acyltransferase